MPRREFSRLTNRVLARMGEDAVLRGDTPCRVNVQHGVEVAEGDYVYRRSVAVIERTHGAADGDTLDLVTLAADGSVASTDARYKLDGPAREDNGYSQQFVLRVV